MNSWRASKCKVHLRAICQPEGLVLMPFFPQPFDRPLYRMNDDDKPVVWLQAQYFLSP